jgi:hypothetical protein
MVVWYGVVWCGVRSRNVKFAMFVLRRLIIFNLTITDVIQAYQWQRQVVTITIAKWYRHQRGALHRHSHNHYRCQLLRFNNDLCPLTPRTPMVAYHLLLHTSFHLHHHHYHHRHNTNIIIMTKIMKIAPPGWMSLLEGQITGKVLSAIHSQRENDAADVVY